MDDSTGFVVPALAGPGRLKAGLHASSVSSMLRSPQYGSGSHPGVEIETPGSLPHVPFAEDFQGIKSITPANPALSQRNDRGVDHGISYQRKNERD
jgi:hypothetical protein